MACHGEELAVVQSGSTFSDLDVYKVSAVTGERGELGNVSLDLNCDEVKYAYEASCARAEGTFEEFYAELQQGANDGANAVYTEARALMDTWETLEGAQRINNIRICVRVFRWIRIYVIWHI